MLSRRGILLIVLALTVLGTLSLVLALRLRDRGTVRTRSTVLVWDVPNSIAEAPPSGSVLSLSTLGPFEPTLLEATRGIRQASHDDRVRALVMHVDGLDWGWARVQEVRAAIREFRAAGKPVYTCLGTGAENAYLLGSAADVLSLPATAQLHLNGLAASVLFLRGTYDKLDVRPNFEHIGAFKSAAETYTRSDMSEPARMALESLLDDAFTLLVDSLAAARGLERDSVRALIDRGPFEADDALAQGLVDTLLNEIQVDSLAVERTGERCELLDFDDYIEDRAPAAWGPSVGVIYAEGEIVSGRTLRGPFGGGGNVGSETLIAHLREARERRSVRAVVLRIDSPGGDADASDAIWHEVERLRREKPVIVSLSDVAASGGYYIAVAGDSILAEPGSITGSIGIYGGKLNLLGLYRKLGMNVETLSRGARAEMMSPYRDFTLDEREAYRRHLERFYSTFLARVARGRGMSLEDVDSVGQGRVWSGTAALERGLVDDWGGLEDAIRIASRRAGLPDAGGHLEVFPHRRSTLFDRWASGLIDEEERAGALGRLPRGVRLLIEDSGRLRSGVQARMPFDVVWN